MTKSYCKSVLVATGNPIAYQWGHEDATDGEDMRGSEYFVGVDLESYLDGYAAGLAVAKALNPVQSFDEIAFLEQALASLQAGKVQPIAVMPSELMDAIDDEAIGEIFSRQPYLF